jgi:phosphoglycerate dehydrogenase-like enzyme
VFTTWGFPALTAEQVAALPKLKAIFYGAGTVQYFARPFLERGVIVASAWRANAVPVAEYALAQILQSCKSTYRLQRDYKKDPAKFHALRDGIRGAFGETVALLGAGAIGKIVIQLLKPFKLRVVVFDPFLTEAQAQGLNVIKVPLAAAFQEGWVVSNHLANLPETRKMLTREHFASMRQGATFINTGRNATIDDEGLFAVLRERPDLTALIDVTEPTEPPAPDSPFCTLPNIFLTPHIAGSNGDEVVRLADYMIEDAGRWLRGEALQHQVSLEMLATMA